VRRRVLVAIVGVTVATVILFGVPLAFVFEQLQNEDASLRLEREAFAVALSLPRDLGSTTDSIELAPSAEGVIFGLYDAGGSLIAGEGPEQADEATRRALLNEVADLETSEVRVAAVPISVDVDVVGAVRAEQSNVAGEARTGWILVTIGLIGLLVIVVGAVTGYVVSGRLARPVLSLRDAAVRLGDGDFAIDVSESRVAEVDEAATALAATARRLEDLLQRERMFSSDVSHQLRTPVAGLRTALETELQFPREDPTEVLREALEDLDRLEKTIDELLSIARRHDGGQTSLSPVALFAELEAKWGKQFAAAGRELSIESGRGAPEVRASRSMLIHALDVLLDNALRHGSGRVGLDLEVGQDSATISVSDEGEGFPSSMSSDSLFSPDPETSQGLGLPLARRLVETMGGRMSVRGSGPGPRIDIVLARADR
jgi:signal transduction histidine kinase